MEQLERHPYRRPLSPDAVATAGRESPHQHAREQRLAARLRSPSTAIEPLRHSLEQRQDQLVLARASPLSPTASRRRKLARRRSRGLRALGVCTIRGDRTVIPRATELPDLQGCSIPYPFLREQHEASSHVRRRQERKHPRGASSVDGPTIRCVSWAGSPWECWSSPRCPASTKKAGSPSSERRTSCWPGPGYAIDDETAIKVIDGDVEVVSEGRWRLLPPPTRRCRSAVRRAGRGEAPRGLGSARLPARARRGRGRGA